MSDIAEQMRKRADKLRQVADHYRQPSGKRGPILRQAQEADNAAAEIERLRYIAGDRLDAAEGHARNYQAKIAELPDKLREYAASAPVGYERQGSHHAGALATEAADRLDELEKERGQMRVLLEMAVLMGDLPPACEAGITNFLKEQVE